MLSKADGVRSENHRCTKGEDLDRGAVDDSSIAPQCQDSGIRPVDHIFDSEVECSRVLAC